MLALTQSAIGIEAKPPYEVRIDDLTKETQIALSTPRTVDLAWWLPIEFWDAVLSQDPTLSEEQRTIAVQELSPVFVIAIAQADVSPDGAFNFFTRPPLAVYHYGDETLSLSPLAELTPGLRLMLKTMKSVLEGAIGSLGRNLQFFVYEDSGHNGRRLISPYESGQVAISLLDRAGTIRNVAEINLPLDSLFVPRVCPNGRPAHVSWRFCPWDGSALPN